MEITKMHGLGNDFIIMREQAVDYSVVAKTLCERRLNVGADGLIVVAPSDRADVRMRIFNSDGSEAEMCGNGIRCFARYVYDNSILKKETMEIETLAGIIKPHLLLENGRVTGVRVDMGKPDFTPEKIPVLTDTPMDFEVTIGGKRLPVSSVLMGVPHTIVFCEDVAAVDIDKVGAEIEKNCLFPRKTNVDFVQVIDRNTVRIKTWERGAGRTLACGTGATSAGIIAYKKGLCGAEVGVKVEAGELLIENMPDGRAFMTGSVAYVFAGDTI